MKQPKKPTRYALLSVFDKKDIEQLARSFVAAKITIIATDGTAKFLKEKNIPFIYIEEITHSPESFDGRMKTISFQIASGILFDRTKDSHQKEAKSLGIPSIDFVVCNFYPFCSKPGIEMIDVGGPTMVRAAAKNFESVTVLIDPADYWTVIEELNAKDQTKQETRHRLAAKAFSYVTFYDADINDYFSKENQLSTRKILLLTQGKKLRYGENPHQKGFVYKEPGTIDQLSFDNFNLLQGKEPSFNNLLDLHAAVETLCLIGQQDPACVIVKHNNPCGASNTTTIHDAFQKAWYDGDPLAAFGGIIAMNRPADKKLAELLTWDNKFFEVLAAPSYTKEAKEILARKPKLQLYENARLATPNLLPYTDIKRIRGGFLLQDGNIYMLTKKDITVATKKKPTRKQLDDMLFAWYICQVSKSNCVVAVKDKTLLASGVGQQDRKRCCELCVTKATKPLTGAVAATDGFFPFSDGPEVLINAGITAIIQPGGSIRDKETIDLCNKKGVTMIMTGIRTFKH